MIAIISLIIAVLIPLIIWIRKSYLEGPELTVEIEKDGGSSSPIGFSHKNIPDADGVIEMREALQIFRLTWEFNINIRNNSEYTAYYPKISFPNSLPPFVRIDKLNEQEAIASKAKVTLKAVYQELEEKKGYERNPMHELPSTINELRLLLEYKNSSKSRFFTFYKNIDGSNNFSRRKPKGFDI